MFDNLKHDLPASIAVSLVALPLCLGIALASGAPLFSGIISGIVGGIVIGLCSGSTLGVSGPAAGLAVIVFNAIDAIGAWEGFLVAVILCGVFQILFGYLKAGFIAYFFPGSIIKGMLTGIGLLIILKQIPHALGYDHNVLIGYSFFEVTGDTTFSSITNALSSLSLCAIIISSLSLLILILWESKLQKIHKIFQIIPGPLVVVIIGILLNQYFSYSSWFPSLTQEHLVNIPPIFNFSDFFNSLIFPDFNYLSQAIIWKTALVLAVIASIETLLCVDATDKQDPLKRVTPMNRELTAQGIGNIVSGMMGGLPLSQVIVRSSANIAFGAKSKLSTILHGLILFICVITITKYLNMIPIASLSTILIIIGYKLSNPKIFKNIYKTGWEQFVPFITTIFGILIFDLLTGIFIGMVFGVIFTLHHSYRNAYHLQKNIIQEDSYPVHHIVLAEEVSFFNKASIIELLNSIPKKSKVIIDCSKTKSLAYDVAEYIYNFRENAKSKEIDFQTIAFDDSYIVK